MEEPLAARRALHPSSHATHLTLKARQAASDINDFIRASLNREVGLSPDAPFGAALALPVEVLPRWITVRLPQGVSSFDRSCHDPGNGTFKRIHWWTQPQTGGA